MTIITRLNSRPARVLLALGIVALIAVWSGSSSQNPGRGFAVVPVTRGDLDIIVAATGTVEPEEVVDVGAQVAGRILSFGTNERGQAVDYGSAVSEGSVLAHIDDSLYLADVASADAELKRSQADLLQLRAKLEQAGNDWRRVQSVGKTPAIASTDFDRYRTTFESAKASVSVGEAVVLQAEAQLSRAKRNLSYTTITSPVQGIVIDRRVNIGQTVVASLNAPSLFLIAKDLRRMEVWAAVNEADIGRVKTGQEVTFLVDAFPGEMFHGTVGQIRLNAAMIQNVVTYTVEILTDNTNGRLLPYLTANVTIHVDKQPGVLLVPNAALRWSPSPEERSKATAAKIGAPPQPRFTAGVVWAFRGNSTVPIPVWVGGSDGISTEVTGIEEGTKVIIGRRAPDEPEAGKNPFAPAIRGKRRG